MRTYRGIAAFALLIAMACSGRVALGYVEAAYPLGKVTQESSNVLLMQVEKVDKEKNTVVFRKVRDLKGTHKTEQIKHIIGRGGFHPREWQNIMAWARPGESAVMFHNGGMAEVCIESYWYQMSNLGDWWSLTHAEPFMLRTFAGRPEKLATLMPALLAGQEIVVPCMVDGDKNALHLRNARVQRIKAGLKIQDYTPQRDFVGWGDEEFRPIAGMGGFTHYAALSRVDPGAAGAAPIDFDGDGKEDICLYGGGRVVLLQNAGGAFNEMPLPIDGGARAAAWADFNGDGRPDLLLATPSGPRLFANEGNAFRDASDGLPRQSYYHTLACAWLDFDGDKRPDILVADGFLGLRLWRNQGAAADPEGKAKLGVWYYAGPFDNPGGRGFDAVYPPEREIDLKKQYAGKNNEPVVWREGHSFRDGQINDLRLFKPELNDNCAVYLYRELDFGGAAELPVSLGSDDTLTVWLNGQRIHAENTSRSCTPDQVKLKLRLKPGRNALLLKICNGSGDFAFYFAAAGKIIATPQVFEDVSDRVGLGSGGIGGGIKGDHLAVADVNGDGRMDFLYSAGNGLLVLGTPQGFGEARDCGISYQPGKIAPVFGDYDGDGRPDLFVPQQGRCKLFHNEGNGRFTEVTSRAGDLAGPIGHANCAVWADFFNHQRLDLLVGCLKGPNRCFRNHGDGTFTDATDEIGFYQRIFNSRGLGVLDFNKDGTLDLVLANEGQESAVLVGNPARATAKGSAQAVAEAEPATMPPRQRSGAPTGGTATNIAEPLAAAGPLAPPDAAASGGSGPGGAADSPARSAALTAAPRAAAESNPPSSSQRPNLLMIGGASLGGLVILVVAIVLLARSTKVTRQTDR